MLKHSPPLCEAQLRTDGASDPPLTGSIVFLLPSDPNAPFAQWNTERVCMWLEDFGLAQYVIFARQWVTSGHTLLTATPQDMEKVRAEPPGKEIPIFPQTDACEVRCPNPPGPPFFHPPLHTQQSGQSRPRLPLLLQIDPLSLCRIPLPPRWNISTQTQRPLKAKLPAENSHLSSSFNFRSWELSTLFTGRSWF